METFDLPKPLIKSFKKFPHQFWMDTFLIVIPLKAIDNRISKKKLKDIGLEVMEKFKGKVHFSSDNLDMYISKLVADGYLVADKFTFSNNLTMKMPDTYIITELGKSVPYFEGYLKKAEKEHKSERKFNFEYYKIGYDTVASLLSIILSILALYFSLKK